MQAYAEHLRGASDLSESMDQLNALLGGCEDWQPGSASAESELAKAIASISGAPAGVSHSPPPHLKLWPALWLTSDVVLFSPLR